MSLHNRNIDDIKEELRLAREMRYEFTACESSTVFTNAVFTFIEEAEKALKAQYARLYKESPETFALPEWEAVSTEAIRRRWNGFCMTIMKWSTDSYRWQISDLWGENMWIGHCTSHQQAKAETDAAWAGILKDLAGSP
jgi:hypothetical protein